MPIDSHESLPMLANLDVLNSLQQVREWRHSTTRCHSVAVVELITATVRYQE